MPAVHYPWAISDMTPSSHTTSRVARPNAIPLVDALLSTSTSSVIRAYCRRTLVQIHPLPQTSNVVTGVRQWEPTPLPTMASLRMTSRLYKQDPTATMLRTSITFPDSMETSLTRQRSMHRMSAILLSHLSYSTMANHSTLLDVLQHVKPRPTTTFNT